MAIDYRKDRRRRVIPDEIMKLEIFAMIRACDLKWAADKVDDDLLFLMAPSFSEALWEYCRPPFQKQHETHIPIVKWLGIRVHEDVDVEGWRLIEASEYGH